MFFGGVSTLKGTAKVSMLEPLNLEPRRYG